MIIIIMPILIIIIAIITVQEIVNDVVPFAVHFC